MDRIDRFSLPLLARELVQLAARAQTYIIRVTYVGILLLISWLVLYFSVPSGATNPLEVLGVGRTVMQTVGYLQNISLLLLLPALACGAFTIEKERNTLSMLFLTRLGPWTILFEKLMSRLVLTAIFLMVGFPVLAFCYALGGITLDQLFAQFLSLFVNAFSIICIAVMCSAYFRTTTSALMATYLLLFVLRVGIAIFVVTLSMGGRVTSEEMLFSLLFAGNLIGAWINWPLDSQILITLVAGIPWMVVSGICILLARWFLVSRAFLTPRNPVKEFFKLLDRIFDRANNNALTRGIVVLRPVERLPVYNPVSWRETTTRSLGQVRYLIRILVALEMPVLAILLNFILMGNEDMLIGTAAAIEVTMWMALTLLTCVLSASLVSGERSRQTLDVLLTSPLSGREIINDKLAGIERLIWILEVPLWTCVIVRCLTDRGVSFALCQASMLLIFPRQFAWYGMWFSLTGKSTIGAVVKTLLALLVQCIGPFIVLYSILLVVMVSSGFQGPGDGFIELASAIAYFSPLTIFVVSEFDSGDGSMANGPWLMIPIVGFFVSSMIHLGFLFWARNNCLGRADQLLGRARGADVDSVSLSAYPVRVSAPKTS